MPAKKTTRRPQKPLKKSSKAAKSKRAVHKRFFLHPMTIMVMLVAGVFIAGYTYKAVADSFTVTAEIQAPALTDGSYITSPTDNQSFKTDMIEVVGTCPSSSYTKLYDNSLFVGVAWCSPSNTFQIAAQLYYGNNILQAQDYNITDQAGPVTPTVTAIYEPVSSSSGGGTGGNGGISTPGHSSVASQHTSSSAGSAEAATPLLLTSDFQFKTEIVNSVFSWSIDLSDGFPPYYVNANWGDGSSTNYTFKTDPVFSITHPYLNPGYYPIIVKAVDSRGSGRIIQLAALIKKANTGDIFALGGTSSGSCSANGSSNSCPATLSSSSSFLGRIFGHIKAWVWVTWSTYTIILLMMISFWLGEREEDYHIFRRRYKYAHKHR